MLFFPTGVLSCFLSDHLSSFQSLQVKVTPGKVKVEDPARLEEEEKAEEKRLAIMMMKKKEKYLYDKIMFGKKRKVREVCFFFKIDLNMDLFRSDCETVLSQIFYIFNNESFHSLLSYLRLRMFNVLCSSYV